MRRTIPLALALSGCTAVTGATDFKVDDTRFSRDFDYTFIAMSPHASKAMNGTPMELALVDQNEFAQSRARVYFPPAPGGDAPYPDVRVRMKNALWSGSYSMSFYIDDNENYRLDTKNDDGRTVLEHTWVEDVQASGVGSFTHSTQFEIFDSDAVRGIGADVLIRTPSPSALDNLTIRKCVSDVLSDAFDETVEIRVLFIEEDGTERQMGLFKTFPGVVLPREIKLEGILDTGSDYTIEIARDAQTTVLDFPAVEGDIVLEAEDWLDVPASSFLGCRG